MNIIKKVGKILQRLLIILLSVILLCNLYVITVRTFLKQENPTLLGFAWAIVITGSMEPAVSADDMVITQKQSEYKAGDIIMFESGDVLVTHRIAKETEDGFITKGDANNTEDASLVKEERIVGKVVFIIPNAGLVLGYAKTPFGMMCLILLGFMLIEIPYLMESRKQNKEEGCEENDM